MQYIIILEKIKKNIVHRWSFLKKKYKIQFWNKIMEQGSEGRKEKIKCET